MGLFRGRANGLYYADKFCGHLALEHGLVLKDYCRSCLGIVWPRCPVTGEEVGYKATGAGVLLRTFKRFAGVTKAMSQKVAAAAEKAKVTRRGSGNPMSGKRAWNRNLPAGHPYIERMAARRRGIKEGPETRRKQSHNRRRHPLKARHTTPHSLETKRKISMRTASMHTRHAFGRESSVHLAMRAALSSLGVNFIEEYPAKFYSIDFALPDAKLALEADGDFFHTNPLVYANGPQCAIQRRTARNDASKNSYLRQQGWIVLRYWESEIKAPGFTQRLRGDLERLGVLTQPEV